MHTITKKDNQVFIQIQSPKEKTIESIQECKEGRCSCKTEEYKKMEKIEMEEKKENLSITLTAKEGEEINTSEIEKCIQYAAGE